MASNPHIHAGALAAAALVLTPIAHAQPAWRTYRFDGLRFDYPAGMEARTTSGGSVALRHSIRFGHDDPCYLRDGDAWRDDLVDFELTLESVAADLSGALAAENEFIAGNVVTREGIVPSGGYVRTTLVGGLPGYRIWHSVEGCGVEVHLLRLSADRTLRATRRVVFYFAHSNPQRDSYLRIPGVIAPDAADRIFERIVASVRETRRREP